MGWDEFLTLAVEYLTAQQERLRTELSLGHWPRYDFDQETGTLIFSTEGKAGAIADIQVVGSTGESSGTWLWSWGNDSILEPVKRDMDSVRAYGETHGFEKLIARKWPGDEHDGWEMTAVAAYILRSDGGYRVPFKRGALFMVMRNARRVA